MSIDKDDTHALESARRMQTLPTFHSCLIDYIFSFRRECGTYQSDKYKKTVMYTMYMAHMKTYKVRSTSVPMIVRCNAEAYNNTNIDPDPVNIGKRAP